MGNRKNNNRKHATVKRSRKKMKAVKKGYTASQPPRVALGSLPERPEDWSQMLRIICRDIVLDPCANVGDYRNVGQQFSFQVRTAGGDAVECTAKTRHPNTDRRVKRPAATEEHCDHLQPLMVELSPSELAADLVVVRCWSDQQRTGEPLSTTLFIKQDERLRLLVENATMRARIIRTAGCSGDWRLDECCGNEYIPAGIGAMATDKSCMFQEPAGHQPAYTGDSLKGEGKALCERSETTIAEVGQGRTFKTHNVEVARTAFCTTPPAQCRKEASDVSPRRAPGSPRPWPSPPHAPRSRTSTRVHRALGTRTARVRAPRQRRPCSHTATRACTSNA